MMLYIAVLCMSTTVATAFAFLSKTSMPSSRPLLMLHAEKGKSSSWSVSDNWSALSNENPDNNIPDSDEIFNENLAKLAAGRMELSTTEPPSEEDEWISEAVDEVHNHGMFQTANDPSLYDTTTDMESSHSSQTVSFLDEMGQQIAMLVNCNQRPEDMLISEGRALAPLTDEEKNDVGQLVVVTTKSQEGGEYEATEFFRDAISTMFYEHAKSLQGGETNETYYYLDAQSVAQWMTKCVGDKITPHDRRVLTIMSTYARYGTGKLDLQGFHRLYLSSITNFLNGTSIQAGRNSKMELPTVESIWRDIRNHGILSPVEVERKRLEDEIRNKFGTTAGNDEFHANRNHLETLMDECEIVEWNEGSTVSSFTSGNQHDSDEVGTMNRKKSSFELVEMASDGKTPIRMKDGEFVFIDEESCIGCTMCVTASPSSFLMLENGRARMFAQRRTSDVSTAIEVCPVSCMHRVSFDELKEMETARDHGDGRSDHRHLGHRRGHTPLSVAGIDSDSNHRSSWYHYLKHKCFTSSDCPKRGCFDCPNFRSPGENPYFIEKQKVATRLRLDDMKATGVADTFRKVADL